LLFVVFLRYVFVRLRAARALGRALDRAGDPMGARVRPLAWGMTAALAGTMAANFFYLTMQFYYFYGFVALALALPVVFARRRARCRRRGRDTRQAVRRPGLGHRRRAREARRPARALDLSARTIRDRRVDLPRRRSARARRSQRPRRADRRRRSGRGTRS